MVRGKGKVNPTHTLAELKDEFPMPTHAIVNLDEILEHMGDQLSPDDRARIASYRAEYGAAQD